MKKRKQKVWTETKFSDGRTLSGEVEGTNTGNLQSKMGAWFRRLLIQNNLDDGAVITVRISKAEVDEFANPER